MDNPDSEGYVNVLWPSGNVPHGGIFHTRIADPSVEQQQLLKVLLEESKFNLKLRETRAFGLRGGDEGVRSRAALPPAQVPVLRPRTSRRRSLSAIRNSGALDVDTYRPIKLGGDREHMKTQLANMMAFGDSEQAPPTVLQRKKKPTPSIPTVKETWNELVTQIRERAEWLAEMEWLGEGAPHREIVQDQIAERMRALDALGVDSACSSARSTVHSIMHSSARLPAAAKPKPEVRSSASPKAVVAKKSFGSASTRRGRPQICEENVAAYSQLSPLGYSPRRRV